MANFFLPPMLHITLIILIFGKSINLSNFTLPNTFHYFAYGSNLLEKRLHRSCPSAVREGIGKLNNYKFTFDGYSERWHGATATIAPSPGRHLWGAIWKIDGIDFSNLHCQESSHFCLQLDVEELNGTMKKCVTYQIREIYKHKNPCEKPYLSKIYLDTITQGAKESNLPENYQKFLQTIPHNDYDEEVDYDILMK